MAPILVCPSNPREHPQLVEAPHGDWRCPACDRTFPRAVVQSVSETWEVYLEQQSRRGEGL